MPDIESEESSPSLQLVRIIDILPNEQQPRRVFKPDELAELSASIKEKGIIQPLVVRALDEGFELIAGERRLRASEMAGLTEVPVRIMEVTTDQEMLELSLIENLQREDLNPVELAEGYKKLQQEWGLTQEQIAKKVGKERATIANMIRLLELPETILKGLQHGEISVGHSKALLSVLGKAQQSALYKRIISDRLSVRQTEEAAKRANDPFKMIQTQSTPSVPVYIKEYTNQLRQTLGTKVQIKKKGKKGTIQIEFYSDDDLERLMELMS